MTRLGALTMFVRKVEDGSPGMHQYWMVDVDRDARLTCVNDGGPTRRALFRLELQQEAFEFFATHSAGAPAGVQSIPNHLHWAMEQIMAVSGPRRISIDLAVASIAIEALLAYGINYDGDDRDSNRGMSVSYRGEFYSKADFRP